MSVSTSTPLPATPIWLFWAASPRRAIVLSLIIAVLVMGAALVLNGIAVPGWHAAVRATAIFAYPFWLLAFTAGAVARLFPNDATRALRKRRRAVGLAFAVAQYVHFTAIAMLARIEPEVLDDPTGVIGGGFGFVMVALMAATSNDVAVRRLGGRNWSRLHGAGQLTLAIVYLVTYGGRVAEDLAFWPGLALLFGAIGLRAAAAIQLRRRRTTLPTE